MFTIQDAPDPAPVEAWIGRFIAALRRSGADDRRRLRRMMKVVRQRGVDKEFVAALVQDAKIRPRPKARQGTARDRARAAGDHGETNLGRRGRDAGKLDLKGRRLGLQLYPDKDHGALTGGISAQGAEVDTVLPYIYDQGCGCQHRHRHRRNGRGPRRCIALTNLGQVRRLIEAARAHGREDAIAGGLERTLIASVGPAVSGELQAHGLRTESRRRTMPISCGR